MPFSDYVAIARNTFTDSDIFGLDTSAVNLIIKMRRGDPEPNILLNTAGEDRIYLHCRMRFDKDPSAIYDDGSDGVWMPLKGRLVAVSDKYDIEDVEEPLEPTGEGLELYPGQQLSARYQGVNGIFIPMIKLQHPYDLSAACGLRIRGLWKRRLN